MIAEKALTDKQMEDAVFARVCQFQSGDDTDFDTPEDYAIEMADYSTGQIRLKDWQELGFQSAKEAQNVVKKAKSDHLESLKNGLSVLEKFTMLDCGSNTIGTANNADLNPSSDGRKVVGHIVVDSGWIAESPAYRVYVFRERNE